MNKLPDFLKDYGSLLDHMNDRTKELTNSEKGRFFADFSRKIVKISSLGRDYPDPILSEKISHDHGVDFYAESEGGKLFGQAKYTLNRVKDLDSVISYFQSRQKETHEDENRGGQMSLPLGVGMSDPKFVVVTLSRLETALQKYANSGLSSVEFFNQLKSEQRITFIDGEKILSILKVAYRQSFELPARIDIRLQSLPLQEGNVYIGIVSSEEIKRQYERLGDAIFLENIRVFLGLKSGRKDDHKKGRKSVNEAIAETVSKEPEKMLARNNGITFRAASVERDRENQEVLHLKQASIVNGCQITMTLVNGEADNALVLVKIVQTEDSWDIAKAANFQNEVKQVELDLARFIRPQIVQRVTAESGFAYKSSPVASNASITDVLGAIYQHEIDYSQTYYLFIGLFSRTANNAISPNYAELRYELLNEVNADTQQSKKIYSSLFEIVRAADEARVLISESKQKSIAANHFQAFQRFYNADNGGYHAFVTILACSSLTGINIYSSTSRRLSDLASLLESTCASIRQDSSSFQKRYVKSFSAIMNGVVTSSKDSEDMKKSMNSLVKTLKFDMLLSAIVTSQGTEDIFTR